MSHPYWSYGPDSGQPALDALNEGRRLRALELAVESLGSVAGQVAPGSIVGRAQAFEEYLKGESE